MRTDRIVQRHSQREQLQNLKTMMRESRPLIEADKQLRKAYMAGYRRRVEEEIAEDKAKQEALQASRETAAVDERNAAVFAKNIATGELDPAVVDDAISQELSPEDYDGSVNLLHVTDIAAEMKAVPSELELKQNEVRRLFEEALKPCYDTEDQGTAQADQ